MPGYVRLIGKSFPDSGIEIWLHNLADPSHSLVALENNVTGRHLRDGTTSLLIDLKKRQIQNQDKRNYELKLVREVQVHHHSHFAQGIRHRRRNLH